MGQGVRLPAVVGLVQALAAAQSASPHADPAHPCAGPGGPTDPAVQETARTAAARLRAALDGTAAAVRAWDAQGEILSPLATDGDAAPASPRSAPGFAAAATAPGGHRARVADAGAPSLTAPLVHAGRVYGEAEVGRAPGGPPFTAEDVRGATALAAVAAAGLAQAGYVAELRRLAYADPLTGLANRRAVDDRLDAALRLHAADGTVVSLAVCDINGLKRVNDAYGHQAGDRLLERFAGLLTECAALLPSALAGRLGGDEFCLLAAGPSAEEAATAAGELCRRAGESALGDGVACGLASTGDPIGPVRTPRRLFLLADAAQYRAKAARARGPVVAGRDGGTVDPVVRLADAPPPHGTERRRFRGR